MRNFSILLALSFIFFLSCINSDKKKVQHVKDSPTAIETGIDYISDEKTRKKTNEQKETTFLFSQISDLKKFKDTRVKYTNRDTLSFKPYDIIYGQISDDLTDKYIGYAILILDSKIEKNRLVWHYFDNTDFPPHTVSFIDFNGDGEKDLFMYAGQEDVFNTSLYINQIKSNKNNPFKKIYENNYSYCSLIDIDKDGLPEIINTISKFEDIGATEFYELDEKTINSINSEYNRIIGSFDQYNMDYNLPKYYKSFAINILDEINILKVEKEKIKNISSEHKKHKEFRVNILEGLKDVPDELKPWLKTLIKKYK